MATKVFDQEILPEPEEDNTYQIQNESVGDFAGDTDSALMREQKQSSVTGNAALSGVTLSSAQGQVAAVQDYSAVGAAAMATTDFQNPASAQDLDLIEKEWVLKAKAIVAATIGDPYQQNVQINRIKADYIKKRYNRDIKVREE